MTTTASSPAPVSTGTAPVGPSVDARHVALPSTYFRAIDGLRGLAVISVVLFHTGLYSNGLFGVDVFMVISGFLITLTLLRERSRTGRISLGGFYRRRAKRLVVPLLITLGATLLLVLHYGRGDDLGIFVRQSIASVLNVANWEQIVRGSSYWDQMAGVHAPLGHMWSLSLTEQFYLLWPPLLVLVALITGARHRLAVGITAAVLVVAMTATTAVLYDGTNANLLYLATFSHGASLLVGALAAMPVLAGAHRRALGTPSRAKLPRGVVGLAGLAILAGIVTLSVLTTSFEAPWLYARGGLTIVAVLCGALLLSLTVEGTWIARALSVAPLVGVGKFSYALFLVHLPVLWGLQMALPDPRALYLALIGLPLSIVLASFLHHIVGEPVRIRRWNRAGTVAFTALLTVVVGGTAAAPALVQQARSQSGPSVLVLGDSLGHDFADALTLHAAGMFTVTDGAFDGCGIFDQETSRSAESDVEQDPGAGCFPWQERWTAHIKVADPDLVVVTLGWDAVQQRRDGHWVDACSPEYREHYAGQLEQMHTVLMEGNEQRKLLVTTTRPFTNLVDPSWARCQTDQLREFAATHDNVEVLELADHVCTASECQQQTPEGNALYLDTVHFTPAGIGWLAPWLVDELTRATTPASD